MAITKNPGMKDLRGDSRRTFLKLVGAAGAAFALERSKVLNYLLDEGGSALADSGSCAKVCRSVHVIGGNGSVAWFQLLWPHLDVAMTTNPAQQGKFAYHSYGVPGTMYNPGGADKPFYYAPEAPWMAGGMPTRPVTAFMAGKNETHTQTPTTPAIVSNNASMLATVASIQRANPVLLPVIGVTPLNFGDAAGAPAIATVPSAQGMIELFNSSASQLTLAAQKDKQLYETYYKAVIGLREAAARPTWSRQLETTKTAANLLGRNLSGALTPTSTDFANYGVTGLAASALSAPGQDKMTAFAKNLIVTAKAFKLGLTNSVIIGLSPGATSETTFTDPHVVFTGGNNQLLKDTVKFMGMMLNAFYADLAASPDPVCTGQTLDKTTVFTVHGDTFHTPLQGDAWPDATPNDSNWIYVMGCGYLRSGWFGGVRADGTTDGFDPTTGQTITGQASQVTSMPAGAAVAYAVCKGDKNLVSAYYNGPPYTGIVV
ncbi:MAG: twin-arginine translocation signal domain-containing protein [Minicystis sp.]